MQSPVYRETLEDALRMLIKVHETIYGSMMMIILQGELKSWGSAVPVGEEHTFEFDLFKNSSDTNILLIVKLLNNNIQCNYIVRG